MIKIAKHIYRFIKYKNQRKKIFREFKINPEQNKLLHQNFLPTTKKLIVFLIPGADWNTGKETMSGGSISIVSICEETQRLFDDNNEIAVILCTQNGDNSLLKYNNFNNNTLVYRFNQVHQFFNNLDEIIIHIPDYMAKLFKQSLSQKELFYLSKIPKVHINIMNQNIRLMPIPNEIETLKSITPLVTITTAHQQYCTQHYSNYFNVPVHKLSVWISPEQYVFKQKEDKENLLIYSPDPHPEKENIIKKLGEIKGLRLQMIENLTYTQFKETISRAKWALTFGEGLDGYILEPIFSGAIGFAVYNDEFFTPKFQSLKTIYPNYDAMLGNIVNDIKVLDNNTANFNQYQHQQFNVCEELYSSKVYKQNIQKFYNHQFTFQ